MNDHVDAILEQWATERPDLDASPMAVVGRLSRVTRRFEDALRTNLKGFGLTPDEFDVLATLRRTGPEYQLNPCDLGDAMMVTSSTVTHRVDKLEARGLLRRQPDPTDRRSVLVRLTPEGRALVDRALEAHLATEHRLLAELTGRQRSDLARLLRAVDA